MTDIQKIIEEDEKRLAEKKALLRAAEKSIERIRTAVADLAMDCEKLMRSHGMSQSTLFDGLDLKPAEARLVSAAIRKQQKTTGADTSNDDGNGKEKPAQEA